MKRDIKAEIIEKIAAKMEETNTLPWESGLTGSVDPISYTTGKAYRGFNNMLLEYMGNGSKEFITYNAAKKAGHYVKKGEKGISIIFWKFWNKTKKAESSAAIDEKDDEIIPILKNYTVFEIEQTDGLEARREIETRPTKSVRKIEAFIKKFAKATNLTIETVLGNGKYSPSKHKIKISDKKYYKDSDAYYSTLFHEMVHSTMRAMGRDETGGFGDKSYSKEEVIAEVGSMFLCRYFGISKEADNSAAYVKGWAQKIKENPDWLINGANAAEKAFQYILKMAGETPAVEGNDEEEINRFGEEAA